MDKNAIKKYAVWARRELISRVSQKAQQYGITEDVIIQASADTINGHVLSATEKAQRQALIIQIQAKGYKQVMEEVAYTWFNRFSALRFMEVNGYLPSRVRVFTDENNQFDPQIIAEAIDLEMDGLDMEKVYAFKNANDKEGLFKYLIIVQCNALSPIMPGMFQRIADYTELLFPDNLLREGSVVERLIADIPADNFDIHSENGQVEIIGWLYQYYNDEKKNEVININKGTIKKEDIPAATQLFTTDWVVRYIIDNSVGRYWVERNPNSSLKSELRFLVTDKSGVLETIDEKVEPQDITVFDPCMGSGHFLVYAFDVLMKIYNECGYTEIEATSEILKHNLYGVDIDDRASQLAYFAVMMKARQYDRRFFRRKIQPNVFSIPQSNGIDGSLLEHFCGNNHEVKTQIHKIVDALFDAKEYGSIIQVPSVDFDMLYKRVATVCEEISLFSMTIERDLLPIIKVADVLSRRYAIVATNPPYLNKYNSKLKDYVYANYKDYSTDLFSVFMYRNFLLCKKDGYSGFMTPFVWMFIKAYEELRSLIIHSKSISTLIQMEYSAFEEATVPICSFVLKNGRSNAPSLCIRLSDFKGGMDIQRQKVEEALKDKECGYFYEAKFDNLKKIPGMPIAYWASDRACDTFLEGRSFTGETKKGVLTGDNEKFLRLWHEVNIFKTGYTMKNHDEMVTSGLKWFPVTSGGFMRKWYGNLDTVVNLENDGLDIRTTVKNYRLRESTYYFREAITWTEVSSGMFSCRYVPEGVLFGNGGPVSFFYNDYLKYTLGFMNSKVVMGIMAYLAPTINYGPEQIKKLPIIINHQCRVEDLVNTNIELSKTEWDSFETSWDFQCHPLINMIAKGGAFFDRGRILLAECYDLWNAECSERFAQLKANEEELNRIFIDIYGLQDELTPEVEEKDVTVRKADLSRDIRSFISYAVGCIFGRYSLDVPGLVYAGGEWDESKYTTFHADKDNILPICDDEYFKDDAVGLFVKFVERIYGEDTLEANLRFIADALGGKGAPRDVIRSYFLNDFYADHLKIYQKRPIYWLFDSGKKNGFKALVYMHRYQPDTIARMRTDYVHEQQSRYRTAIADIEQRIASASTSERVKLNKQLKKLQDQAAEIQAYEEKIHHFADQYIAIDLDDSVKVNYAKFQDVLAKIK